MIPMIPMIPHHRVPDPDEDLRTLPSEGYVMIDDPDPRDYPYEPTFGGICEPADHMPFPLIELQNQSAHEITRMACGQFALCHIVTAQNKIRAMSDGAEPVEISAKDEWERLLQKYPDAQYAGSTLQQNLKHAQTSNHITGYSVVTTKEQIMHALAHQRYIYTGSANGDWRSVRDTKRYRVRRDGKFVGHIIAVGSFTADGVLAINSY